MRHLGERREQHHLLPHVHGIGRGRIEVRHGRTKKLFVALELGLNRRQVSNGRWGQNEDGRGREAGRDLEHADWLVANPIQRWNICRLEILGEPPRP